MTINMEGMRPPKNRFEYIIDEVNSAYGKAMREVTKDYGDDPFRNEKYKNGFKAMPLAERTMEIIKQKLDENRYSDEERIHILESSKYMNRQLGRPFYLSRKHGEIEYQIAHGNEDQQRLYGKLKIELEESISALNDCDRLLWDYVRQYIDELKNTKKDGRKSEKQPTAAEKLKALKTFAPELYKAITSLPGKEDKGNILRLIIGNDWNTSYKLTLSEKKLDTTEVKDLDLYVLKLKEAQNKPT